MHKSNKISNKINLSDLEETLSPERKEIVSRLKKHEWFQKTSKALKNKLLRLNQDYDSYLSDLADRGDEIGGLIVLKMKDAMVAYKSILNVFEVRVKETNQVINYEYISSRYGKNPGFRGILLLEVDGQIKYFMLTKTEKFAVGGNKIYNSFGGFIQYNHGKLSNFPKKVEEEIKRQLGLNSIEIKRFIDLGLMYPDLGLESHHVSLFAAIINADDAKNIKALSKQTLKTKRNTFEVSINAIDRIGEFVEKVDDSFFLACVLRLSSRGIIKLN